MTRLTSWWLCLLLAAAGIVMGWRAFIGTLLLAERDDAYTHILLILPIAVALVLLEWRSVSLLSTPSFGVGALFLLASTVLAGLARWGSTWLGSDVKLSVNVLALVTWLIASFVLGFGTRVARALLFPLGLLLLLVPLPHAVLSRMVSFLQQGSAWAAHILFAASGVPVAQNGVMLTVPGLTVEVARECSSLRSSSILLVTTMVLSQLLLRSPWRKALVIAIAVPLSVAKNGLRIFTIATLATRVNPAYLTGRLHHDGGIFFFAIALAAAVGLIWILRRAESQRFQHPALIR